MQPIEAHFLLSPIPAPAKGSQREGLCSLFRRTCERNQLSVIDVIHLLMLPLSGPSAERAKKLVKPVHLLNMGGSVSERFIQRMQEVSIVPGLMEATLKELSEVERIPQLLASPFRKWCPMCYEDDCFESHGPYDRLLWSINRVEACPVHEVKLENTCSSCKASNLKTLTGLDISGFCPKCRSWNGGLRPRLSAASDDYSRYLLWISQSFADLLDDPLPVRQDAVGCLLKFCRELADLHFDGNQSHFAKAIVRNKSVVSTWHSLSAIPKWDAVCDISYVFQVPLRSLLVGDSMALQFSQIRNLPLGSVHRSRQPRRAPRTWDDSLILQFFAEVEAGQYADLLSLNDVATRLGIDTSQLHKRLPEECRRLSALLVTRRSFIRQRREEARAMDLIVAAKKIAADISGTITSVTRREVQRRMAKLGLDVRWNESVLVRKMVQEAVQLERTWASGNICPP